jgi:hypothetical protein
MRARRGLPRILIRGRIAVRQKHAGCVVSRGRGTDAILTMLQRFPGKGGDPMTVKDALLREIETLPEQNQAEVLAYVRFVKIGLADIRVVNERFDSALTLARARAKERGITEKEIAEEIAAARAEQ